MENLPKALGGAYLLCWTVTYPVDKVVRSLNNWGQVGRFYPISFQNFHIAAMGEKNRQVCPHQSVAKIVSNSPRSAFKIARCVAGFQLDHC